MDVKEKALFILLIVAALLLRVKDITRPFDDGLRGECGAGYSMMAENMLRQGILAAGFLPVCNTLPVDREHLVYYENHPPTMVALTAVFFLLSGSSGEAAARILPILFSLLSMTALFVLVRRYSGTLAALLAAALASSVPLSAYYGAFLNFETFFVPWVLLSLHDYGLWIRDGRAGHLRRSLAFMAVGALMDWTALIAGGLMMLDGFLFLGGGSRTTGGAETETAGAPRSRRVLLLYPLLGILLFAAVQGWFLIQNARHGSSMLAGVDKIRYYVDVTMLAQDFDLYDFVKSVSGYLVHLATWPVTILALAGFLVVVKDLCRRRPAPVETRAVLILLAWGMVNLLLFANHAWRHDYWLIPLYPALYWCAALAVERGIRLVFRSGERPRGAFTIGAAAVIALLLCHGSYRTLAIMKEKRGAEELFHRGLSYKTLGRGEELILSPKRENLQVIRYSGGRIFPFPVPTPEALEKNRSNFEKYGYASLPMLFAVHRAEEDRFRASIEAFGNIAAKEEHEDFIFFRLN